VATQRQGNDDAQRADHALSRQTARRRPATSRSVSSPRRGAVR
jgi:hypothetical protein